MDILSYIQSLNESKNSKDDLKLAIIERFKNDKLVTIEELENIAKDYSTNLKEVEYIIFEFLHNLLYRKHRNFIPNEKELEMGIKDEMEHTKDKEIAKSIALDHLAIHPNYYTVQQKAGL